MIDSTVHIGNIHLYILVSVFFFFFLKLLERSVIVKLLKLQLVTKLVETLCPTGHREASVEGRGDFLTFYCFHKEEIKPSLPTPSMPSVLLFELPVENNKHPNFE